MKLWQQSFLFNCFTCLSCCQSIPSCCCCCCCCCCDFCSPYKFWGPGGSGKPDWVHVIPAPDMCRWDPGGRGGGVSAGGGGGGTALITALSGKPNELSGCISCKHQTCAGGWCGVGWEGERGIAYLSRLRRAGGPVYGGWGAVVASVTGST
jgi:hypothetical protein